jgi:hypothetical protein
MRPERSSLRAGSTHQFSRFLGGLVALDCSVREYRSSFHAGQPSWNIKTAVQPVRKRKSWISPTHREDQCRFPIQPVCMRFNSSRPLCTNRTRCNFCHSDEIGGREAENPITQVGNLEAALLFGRTSTCEYNRPGLQDPRSVHPQKIRGPASAQP